jgi:zinc protease
MTFRIGDAKSLEGKRMAAYLAGRMLRKGTAKATEQQIKDELDGLKASVNVFASQGSVNINIETVRDNLPRTLEIVTDMLMNSTMPEKEFKDMVQEELAGTEQQLSDPQYLAQNAMTRHMNPYVKTDIRYNATPQEEIEELKQAKVEDVRKFYKDFYGASNATVSIIGDFDEAKAQSILAEGLGKWKSPKPYVRMENKYFEVPTKNEAIKTPDKANAMFLASLNVPMRDDDMDYPSIMIGNVVLGGGALSSRLANRIRQKEGISYGVGSGFQADPLDKSGGFFAYAIYAPENVERLEKAFKEEVERIVKDGITAEELESAKKYIAQNRLIGRSNDKQLSGKMNQYLFINRNMQWDKTYEEKVAKLTVEDVNKALKKYIVPEKISMFKAGDFDKVVKKP